MVMKCVVHTWRPQEASLIRPAREIAGIPRLMVACDTETDLQVFLPRGRERGRERERARRRELDKNGQTGKILKVMLTG